MSPTFISNDWKRSVIPQFMSCSPTEEVPLCFRILQGSEHHVFIKNKLTATHGNVRSGMSPRILTAFVEGHAGACLFFEPAPSSQRFTLVNVDFCQSAHFRDFKGITYELLSTTALKIQRRNIRFGVRNIREYVEQQKDHPLFVNQWYMEGGAIVVERQMFNGLSSTLIRLSPGPQTVIYFDEEFLFIEPAAQDSVSLVIEALNNIQPCTPFSDEELFRPEYRVTSSLDKLAFSFLAFHEQFAAGSWRFLQGAFTRDIIFTLSMVMEGLQPSAIEKGLGATISRIASDHSIALNSAQVFKGMASHEDSSWDWGDYLHLLKGSHNQLGMPLRDFRMIDTSFLPFIAFREYLERVPEAPERAEAFLAATAEDGISYHDKLLHNLFFGLKKAQLFAEAPRREHLIGFYEHEIVGDWRDGRNGHGRQGVYPYSVNRSLMPGYLRAIADIVQRGLLRGVENLVSEFHEIANIWETCVPEFFLVTVTGREAEVLLGSYCKREKIPFPSYSHEEDITFPALSLTRAGTPLPIMHSDESFILNYNLPSEEELIGILDRLSLPFPRGLRVPKTGILVANPAYTSLDVQELFTRYDYQGAVVWSWQQAFLITGVQRQLRRTSLSTNIRRQLVEVEKLLWSDIRQTETFRSAELWSWSWSEKRGFEPCIFDHDGTESNVIQLWSTAYFALRPSYLNEALDDIAAPAAHIY